MELENPFHGLLALAQRFIVTGDSLSMIVEAAHQSRPLAIYPPPKRRLAPARLLHELGRFGYRLAALKGPLGSLARSGRLGYARDHGALHRHLYAAGLALPLDEGFSQGGGALPDEVPGAAARICALLGEAPPDSGQLRP